MLAATPARTPLRRMPTPVWSRLHKSVNFRAKSLQQLGLHGLKLASCQKCRRQYYVQKVTSTRQPAVGGSNGTVSICPSCEAADDVLAQKLGVSRETLSRAHLRSRNIWLHAVTRPEVARSRMASAGLRVMQHRDIFPEDYDTLLELRQSKTLNCALREKITSRRFSKEKEASEVNERCLICMEEMLPMAVLCSLECDHTFHAECT